MLPPLQTELGLEAVTSGRERKAPVNTTPGGRGDLVSGPKDAGTRARPESRSIWGDREATFYFRLKKKIKPFVH